MSDDDDTGGGKKKKLAQKIEAAGDEPVTLKLWVVVLIAAIAFGFGAWFF